MNQLQKILATLEKEGALDSKQISERGKIPLGTVRSYVTVMALTGLLTRYKDMKGIFEITDQGKKYLEKGTMP